MNTQDITLDVSKRHATRQTVYIGRGDMAGTIIRAAVNSAGLALGLDDMDVSLVLPGGTLECATSGNVATCEMGEDMVPDGTEFAHLRIFDEGRAYSTERFRIVTLSGYREGQ